MTLTLPDLVVPVRALAARPVTALFDHEAHLSETLAVLLRVRDDGGVYPPLTGETLYAFAGWLGRDQAQARWVALVDGKVAGHIAVSTPRADVTAGLTALGVRSIASNGFCEISKFFVDPELQGHGVGRALFSAARGYAWANAQQPVLALRKNLETARNFCASRGLRDQGTLGSGTLPHHVLVDEAPPWFIASW